MPVLQNGSTFPALELLKVGGGAVRLPDDLAGHFGVVLVYRGAWCPYCNAQLAAFQRSTESLAALDIRVAALSVDDEATSAALVAKHRLGFPVGFGADAEQVAAALGAYTNSEPRFLQSTGFVLDPAGRVLTAVYSSGAIGRLVADDVVGFVRHVREKLG